MKRKGHVAASKMLMLGVVCLATVGAARTASAQVQFRSPFGDNTPVTAVAGYSPDNGSNYIFWNNSSTGECRITLLGNGSLSQSGIIYAPANADSTIRIIAADDGSFVFTCDGVLVRPLIYGGYYLDIVGGAGNDSLWSWGTGDTFIWGQGGNDSIIDGRPGARVTAGTGNDRVLAPNNTPTSYYDLGDGDDCLNMGSTSPPPPSSRVLCGAGSDKIAHGFPSTGQACELFPTTC